MLTPSNRTITIASGSTALVGRTTAIPAPGGGGGGSLPAWLIEHDAAVGLNAWRAIANTSDVGGSSVDEYSGFAEKNGMLISAWSGGHHVSDNRVVSCDFTQDVPAWSLLSAATPFGQVIPDAAFNSDGKPNSCHDRCDLWWSALHNRVVRIGARDLYTVTSPGSKAAVSSFNLDTNAADPAGTFPDIIGGDPYVIGGSFIGLDGSLYTYSGQRKMSPSKVWSVLPTVISPGIRAPWAVAPELNLVFGLAMGDGWQGGTAYRAIKIDASDVQTAITINPSAALTDFQTKAPFECGMHYDAPNNRFLFCGGSDIWVITPNSTNTWDMSFFNYGAGSASPVASIVSNRFIYSRTLKGFFIRPTGGNIHFMRTSV